MQAKFNKCFKKSVFEKFSDTINDNVLRTGNNTRYEEIVQIYHSILEMLSMYNSLKGVLIFKDIGIL